MQVQMRVFSILLTLASCTGYMWGGHFRSEVKSCLQCVSPSGEEVFAPGIDYCVDGLCEELYNNTLPSDTAAAFLLLDRDFSYYHDDDDGVRNSSRNNFASISESFSVKGKQKGKNNNRKRDRLKRKLLGRENVRGVPFPSTSLDILRRRYGARSSVWGEWNAADARRFYKQQVRSNSSSIASSSSSSRRGCTLLIKSTISF